LCLVKEATIALLQSKKSELLQKIPLFKDLSKRQLNKIAKVAYEYPLPIKAGKEIARQGDPGREFYVILKGTAKVKQSGRTIATLSKGDHFGEISLIDSRTRTASVVAETDVNLMGVSSTSFKKLLDDVPGLSKKLVFALCDYVRKAEGNKPRRS